MAIRTYLIPLAETAVKLNSLGEAGMIPLALCYIPTRDGFGSIMAVVGNLDGAPASEPGVIIADTNAATDSGVAASNDGSESPLATVVAPAELDAPEVIDATAH